MEASSPDIKNTPLPQPRRIDAKAIAAGRNELNGYREDLVEEHGPDVNTGWDVLIENMDGQNSEVAKLMEQTVDGIQSTAEKTKAVEGMFILFWAMRAALDPRGQVERSEFDLVMQSALHPKTDSSKE